MMRSNSQKSLHAADEEWGTPRAQETEAQQEQPTNAAQKSNGTKRCFIVDSRWIFVAVTVVLLAIIAILGGVLVSKNKNERNSSESSVTERANEGSTPAVPSPSPTLSMSIRPTPSPTHTPSASPVSMIPSSSPTESSMRPTVSIKPSSKPSEFPTISQQPSFIPSSSPSREPSMTPTLSIKPSNTPSVLATNSQQPSLDPSSSPSREPSSIPSPQPSATTFVSLGNNQNVVLRGEVNDEKFGQKVALSSDGTILLAISLNYGWSRVENGETISTSQIGKVQAFQYQSQNNKWEIKGNPIVDEYHSFDRFPNSIALSDSGNVVAVTQIYEGGYGVVRTLKFDEFTGNWTAYGQELPGSDGEEDYGYGLALNSLGTRLAIGSQQFGTNHLEHELRNPGKVQVFDFNGTHWEPLGDPLSEDDTTIGDRPFPCSSDMFGLGVAFADSGDTLVVGAPSSCSGRKHVTVFRWNNDGTSSWKPLGKTLESGGSAFGKSMGVSSDGNRLALSSSWGVQAFRYNTIADDWEEYGQELENGNSDFGESVALSRDGTTLVVGDPSWNSDEGHGAGQLFVYVFEESSSVENYGLWVQKGSPLAGLEENDHGAQGTSVAVSADGAIVATGAPGRVDPSTTPGFARVYTSYPYLQKLITT